jgi:FkbM family methyltransferase
MTSFIFAGDGILGRTARYSSKALQRFAVTAVAFYMRHTPLAKGRWRLTAHFLPLLRQVGDGMGRSVIRTRRGFRLHVDLSEWIGQHIYLTGDYERPASELMSALAGQGSTVVDVGANIGFFSLLASQCVGPAGRVIAFEPVPSTCAQLRANLHLNGVGNVKVYGVALANAGGTVTMHEGPSRNKGLSSMRVIDGATETRLVPAAAFDDLDVGDASIGLIKIDVEGAEQLVLEGMMRTLAKHRPYLIVEVTERFLAAFGHSGRSLCALLEPLGYQAYEITDDGPALLPDSRPGWPRQFNALFSPRALSRATQ